MFIIRSQGFFYTDEYYAPGEVFKQVVKKTFPTKVAAEKACAALIRKWVRSEPLGNYVFDDGVVIDAIVAYFRETWPEDYGAAEWDELTIPKEATDKQVDEIVKRLEVTFAQVFEVDEDDVEDNDEDDELHYGPRG